MIAVLALAITTVVAPPTHAASSEVPAPSGALEYVKRCEAAGGTVVVFTRKDGKLSSLCVEPTYKVIEVPE